MTSVPDGTEPSGPALERGGDDRELPLAELDRALAAVRRMVGFATRPGATVRYLGVNLAPHVARAARLELPEELAAWVTALREAIDGFDADAPEAQRDRLSRMFAVLARIDTVAGLPLPHRLRPVPKVLQIDVPEAPVDPSDAEDADHADDLDDRSASTAPGEAPRASGAEEDEDDDDETPEEFGGDLGHPIADVAPRLAVVLAECGIRTVGDLLLRRPTVAETLTPVHGAGRELPEGRVAVGGRIRCGFTRLAPGRAPERWSVVVGAGPVRVRWAEPAPNVWALQDRKVVVTGTVSPGPGDAGVLVGGPHPPVVLDDAALAVPDDQTVRVLSWGLPGVSDAAIRELVTTVGPGLAQVRDPVSPEVLRSTGLLGLGAALQQAHTVLSEAARRRLAFDEVLLAQLGAVLTAVSGAATPPPAPTEGAPRTPGRDRGIAHPVLHGFAGRMGQVEDLALYDDAQAHLEEIKRDLRRQVPMRRLLTGEVGAGKGRLALLTAAMVAEAKGQVLMLAGDAAEAEARFVHSEPLLRDGGLVARLIVGKPTRAQLDAIKRGEVHLVFGTIDLLQEPLEFRRLGLVVAVEREAFGRACALHAALPAPKPDLLVVSAIPAGPRVLLTAYADLQVSVLKDPERRPAQIVLCRAEARNQAYDEIRAAVARTEQAMIVFPMVDGHDAIDLPDAVRLLKVLESEACEGLRLGLLHGQMPREDRQRAHEDLLHRRIDVLVCTTRCEEGPPVRNLSVVVIEQADRVDQWRLHRIIGFASRCAPRRATAVLVVGEMAEPDAAARIERVVTAPNGFHLTESLVELKGVARVVGAQAAPLPSFVWFEVGRDLDLLLAAREEVHRIGRADPSLRRGGHLELGRDLRARWDRLFPDAADVGFVCPVRDEPQTEPKRRRRRRRRRR